MMRRRSEIGSRASESTVGLAASFLLISPSIVWIALDRHVFGGDQSAYGTTSIVLYRTLTENCREWAGAMLRAEPSKGPGIAWIGQFFVPLGDLIGSIDFALLLSVCLVQVLSVWLVYLAILDLSDGRRSVATIGALAMSAAPLFVGLTHLFFTEAFQLLATSFFVRVLSQAGRLPAALTLSRLWLVGLYALIARPNAPVFVVVLGLVILAQAVAVGRRNRDWGWRSRVVLVHWITGAALTAVVVLWYRHNFETVVAHVRYSSGEGIPTAWGRKDALVNMLVYWLNTALHSFFRAEFFVLYLVLLGWGVWRLRRQLLAWFGAPSVSPMAIGVLACTCQVAATLLVFSLNTNRLDRFLLPLWPCFVVLIGASTTRLEPAVLKSILATFLLQYVVVQASVFGVPWLKPHASWYVDVLSRKPHHVRVMEEVVDRTCSRRPQDGFVTMLAIDPTLWGDWFAPVPAGFAAAKRYGLRAPCRFDYAGASFFGATLEATWNDIEARNVAYVVTNDPTVYPASPSALNRSLRPENHPGLVHLLETSGLFAEEPALKSAPGIRVFRRKG
jgi:hypothetical protein